MPALIELMRLALALPLAAALVAPRGPSSRPRGRLRQAADEYESTAVDGAFPKDLEGTLYRWAPGRRSGAARTGAPKTPTASSAA